MRLRLCPCLRGCQSLCPCLYLILCLCACLSLCLWVCACQRECARSHVSNYVCKYMHICIYLPAVRVNASSSVPSRCPSEDSPAHPSEKKTRPSAPNAASSQRRNAGALGLRGGNALSARRIRLIGPEGRQSARKHLRLCTEARDISAAGTRFDTAGSDRDSLTPGVAVVATQEPLGQRDCGRARGKASWTQ